MTITLKWLPCLPWFIQIYRSWFSPCFSNGSAHCIAGRDAVRPGLWTCWQEGLQQLVGHQQLAGDNLAVDKSLWKNIDPWCIRYVIWHHMTYIVEQKHIWQRYASLEWGSPKKFRSSQCCNIQQSIFHFSKKQKTQKNPGSPKSQAMDHGPRGIQVGLPKHLASESQHFVWKPGGLWRSC